MGAIWDVELTLDPERMAAGKSPASFLNDDLTIHTSLEDAPEIRVPVMSIVAPPLAQRVREGFWYRGRPRWEGWWHTPNEAGAMLAALACLALGVADQRGRKHWRWALVASGIVAVGALWLLGQTYSRGGWVAFFAGASILAGVPKTRRAGVFGAVAFLAIVALAPLGAQRAGTIASVREDLSVKHRLLVWRGALQMMAEHPWQGVGAGRFGDEFSAWYQPGGFHEHYETAVSSYFTIGAERGIPVLAGMLLGLGVMVYAGAEAARREGSAVRAGLTAAFVTLLTAGFFSSLLFVPAVLWSTVGIGAAMISCIVWKNWNGSRLPSRRALFCLMAGWALLGACLFGIAYLALRSQPAVARQITVGVFSGWRVEPRGRVSAGRIFYLPDAGEEPEAVAKSILRPLAARGWSVVCFPQPEFKQDALGQARAQFRALRREDSEARWVIAGHRQGGETALLVAAEERVVAVAGAGVRPDSPFDDLSPLRAAPRIDVPVLLFYKKSREPVSEMEAKKLAGAMGEAGHECTLLIGGSGWATVLDDFFRRRK